jgi:hypothetical protein
VLLYQESAAEIHASRVGHRPDERQDGNQKDRMTMHLFRRHHHAQRARFIPVGGVVSAVTGIGMGHTLRQCTHQIDWPIHIQLRDSSLSRTGNTSFPIVPFHHAPGSATIIEVFASVIVSSNIVL